MLRLRAGIKRLLGEENNEQTNTSDFNMRVSTSVNVDEPISNLRSRDVANRGSTFALDGTGSTAALKAYFDEKYESLKEKMELNSHDSELKLGQADDFRTEFVSDNQQSRNNMICQKKYNFRHEGNRRQHQFNSEFINLLNEAMTLVEGRPQRPLPYKLRAALTSLEKRERSFNFNLAD